MAEKKEELLEEIEKLEMQIKEVKSSLDEVVKVVKGEDEERVKTYIEGFDEALDGGIKKRHIVLISGTSGTLKSSLALSILYHNLKRRGSKGLYLALEESKESLLSTMEGLKLNDFSEKELMIVDVGRMRLEHEEADKEKAWFRIIEEYLKKKVKTNKVSLVVLDSLTALSSLSRPENLRNELFHFFNFLKGLGVTSFIITELNTNANGWVPTERVEEFLSDGLINLGFVEVNGKVELRIRCIKLRHSNHSPNYFILNNLNGSFVATPVSSTNTVNKDL